MGEKTWPFTGYCFKGEKYQNRLQKKKSEGTGYQGHMHKKKLKTVLRERKHIYASKFACGLRVRKNPLAH